LQELDKVSPPFEGGVAGIADYLIYTMFISRPGWLIYFFLHIFISMKSKIILNIKCLESFSSSLRSWSISTKAALWDIKINHPGRKRPLHYFDICTAATPPSKGGETFSNLSILILPLNLLQWD
jgi:hypothetical protein